MMLDWPLWWVSVCSMLCLLIVEGVIVNLVLYRRDSVTVGTDDDGPGLRLAVVGVCTAAVVAAVVVGYTRWTQPDRDFTRDSAEVVRIATAVSEATATFVPAAPDSSLNRAASFMAPDRAEQFRAEFGKATADLAKRNVSAQAQTISAGLEALGPRTPASRWSCAAPRTPPGNRPASPPRTAGHTVQAGRPLAGAGRGPAQRPLSRA
jgi:hypothetical protein